MVLWTTHLGATKTVNLRGELIQLLLNPPWGQKISKFEHYNILGSVRQRLLRTHMVPSQTLEYFQRAPMDPPKTC